MASHDSHELTVACPRPLARETVGMADGGGGRRMHELIESIFAPAFAGPHQSTTRDAALLPLPGERIAMTTDSYVVQPLFVPGGDIGTLAVNGTVNDLAVTGARPLYLSAAFILEEGLALETLRAIVERMRVAAEQAGVEIVTGDTKVVNRGRGDGLYINTAGVGAIDAHVNIGPECVRQGDAVLVSGDLGRHGMAVMAQREGLAFESNIESDTASFAGIVRRMLDQELDVHCLRDLTRGGLASALVEIAQAAGLGIEIDEPSVPVREDVRGACEILGLEPMYVANEGRLVCIVTEHDADAALAILRQGPGGEHACRIGHIAGVRPVVTGRTAIGAKRIIDLLSGEQLPRIC